MFYIRALLEKLHSRVNLMSQLIFVTSFEDIQDLAFHSSKCELALLTSKSRFEVFDLQETQSFLETGNVQQPCHAISMARGESKHFKRNQILRLNVSAKLSRIVPGSAYVLEGQSGSALATVSSQKLVKGVFAAGILSMHVSSSLRSRVLLYRDLTVFLFNNQVMQIAGSDILWGRFFYDLFFYVTYNRVGVLVPFVRLNGQPLDIVLSSVDGTRFDPSILEKPETQRQEDPKYFVGNTKPEIMTQGTTSI